MFHTKKWKSQLVGNTSDLGLKRAAESAIAEKCECLAQASDNGLIHPYEYLRDPDNRKCNKQLPCGPCVRYGSASKCQFDGLPAQSVDEDVSSHTGAFAHNTVTSDGAEIRVLIPCIEGDHASSNLLAPPAPQNIYGGLDQSEQAPAIDSSTLVSSTVKWTHTWPRSGNVRGRTHISWSLDPFQSLTAFVDKTALERGLGPDCSDNVLREGETQRQQFIARPATILAKPVSIYDEIPPATIIGDLMLRYYDTWDTIYPLLDHDSFGRTYNVILSDPSSVAPFSVIQLLLMMALANATFPCRDAPIPRMTVLRWLNLADSSLTAILNSDEQNLVTIRLSTLLNLARQVLEYRPTRDYIFSSAVVRAAMTLGLHRRETRQASPTPRRDIESLWETVMDLNLHASLSLGLPPAVPVPALDSTRDELDLDRIRRDTSLSTKVSPGNDPLLPSGGSLLSRSLAIRYQIATLLNTAEHLEWHTILRLTRELGASMAPICLLDYPKTFCTRFVAFTHHRFLLALHRPFVVTSGHAIHLARSLVTPRSVRYLRELRGGFCGNVDTFGPVQIGHGAMFRAEAQQTVLMCSLAVYRKEDAIMLDGMRVRGEIRRLLEEIASVIEQNVTIHEPGGETVVIPGLVMAHLAAAEMWSETTEDYATTMTEAGKEAVRRWCAVFQRAAGAL